MSNTTNISITLQEFVHKVDDFGNGIGLYVKPTNTLVIQAKPGILMAHEAVRIHLDAVDGVSQRQFCTNDLADLAVTDARHGRQLRIIFGAKQVLNLVDEALANHSIDPAVDPGIETLPVNGQAQN